VAVIEAEIEPSEAKREGKKSGFLDEIRIE
jgi:hypothetical protein